MVSRMVAPAGVLLAGVLLPLSAQAQGRFTFEPSFRAQGIYDDNLFSTTGENRIASYYARFTPTFSTAYQGRSVTFDAGYGFDADLYPDERSELTDAFAGQRATMGVGFRVARTALLSLNASYSQSNRPGDLVEETGLDLGRREGERYGAQVSFVKNFSGRDSWGVAYDGGLLEYRDSDPSINHNFTTAWEHRFSTQTSTTLRYTYSLYEFGDHLSGSILDGRTAKSHLVTFNGTKQLSPTTRMTLQLGPRLSEDFVTINEAEDLELSPDHALGADALASIEYERGQTSLSLAYTRGENQVFARSGFVDTDSVVFRFGQGVGRSFHFGVSPSAYRNTRGSAETWTYRARADASQTLTRWLHVTASYQYTLQEGRFVNTLTDVVTDDRKFDRNVIMVGLTLGHSFEE